jgi:hypothetical protein
LKKAGSQVAKKNNKIEWHMFGRMLEIIFAKLHRINEETVILTTLIVPITREMFISLRQYCFRGTTKQII